MALRLRLQRRAGPGPLLLDEWQAAPEVLGAVKRAVDGGLAAGSLVLTGRVRARLRPVSWPGTGRVIQIDMYPMTVLEQRASAQPRSEFVERLFAGGAAELPVPPELPDLVGYVDLAIAGGFPPVFRLGELAGRAWLRSYLQQLVLRDVPRAQPSCPSILALMVERNRTGTIAGRYPDAR